MKYLAMVGLLVASVCLAQEQPPAPIAAQPESQTQASAQSRELTVPAGTRIQVTLSSPIHTRRAHRGDPVRAVTAFPVAFHGQMAIPAGTYLEGVLEKVLKRGPSGHPGLQMHFTHMVFASGYTVLLEKATAIANTLNPSGNIPAAARSENQSASLNGGLDFPQAFGPTPQQPPPALAPPPMPGPRIGTVVGIGLAVTAAGIIGAALWARHLRGDVVFDVGSPFEIVLDSPISVDIGLVALADASPAAQ